MLRFNSALLIGRFGNQQHAELLEELLEDQTVCYRSRVGKRVAEIQLRDVALAVLIHLNGEDPADYGFSRVQKSATTVFLITSLTFEKAEDREQAISKWRSREK